MNERLKKLDEIGKFINTADKTVGNILKKFSWNSESVLKNNHGTNKITKIKTDNNDPLYPVSQNWKNSVVIDNTTLKTILQSSVANENNIKTVPNRFSDLQLNFSREEKLSLYDYVIKNTQKLCEPEISVLANETDGQTKHMTFAEIVSLRRDLKRRRLKYRTTKLPPLSYTEELGNLIELQMQALNQYLRNDDNDKKPKELSRSSSRTNPEYPSSSTTNREYPSSSTTNREYQSSSRTHQKHEKNKKRSRSRERRSKTETTKVRRKY